jgi:polysaccharide deacetylase 2 family uncharacterized protein YibQ
MKWTEDNELEAPLVWAFQVIPASVVLTIAPFHPTAHPVAELAKKSFVRYVLVPLETLAQELPPLVVLMVW